VIEASHSRTEDRTPLDVSLHRRSRLRKVIRWTEHLFAVIGVCFVVYHLCFEVIVMTSDSMAPALQGTSFECGDRILVEKISGWFRKPKRWEIYFYYNSEGTPVAKRVVGMPGEKVSIKNKTVYLNGKEAHPPDYLEHLKYYTFGNVAAGREVDCGAGYYVLGDDSRDSYDSRFLGPVPPKDFRGRVWLVLWPFERFGSVR
jgi:signal peptidase I